MCACAYLISKYCFRVQNSIVSSDVKLGENSYISNSNIGKNVSIGSNVTI